MSDGIAVLAEFRETTDAQHWAAKLMAAELIDGTTLSLRWPVAHASQIQRMRDLMGQLHAEGKLAVPAVITVTDYIPQPVQTQEVSLARKAVNVTKAAGRALRQVAKRRPVLVDERTQEGRFSICEACPHFHNGSCADVVLEDGTVERGCGCNLRFKTSVKTEACPHGKW